jgi:hypothetical protein
LPASAILAFIDKWNEIAHPFAWTAKSFEKVLNNVDDPWRRHPHWSDVIAAPTLKARSIAGRCSSSRYVHE